MFRALSSSLIQIYNIFHRKPNRVNISQHPSNVKMQRFAADGVRQELYYEAVASRPSFSGRCAPLVSTGTSFPSFRESLRASCFNAAFGCWLNSLGRAVPLCTKTMRLRRVAAVPQSKLNFLSEKVNVHRAVNDRLPPHERSFTAP